jgi:hypothetical protein
MPQIKVTIANLTGQPQLVHVFDTLMGGTRPVDGSPFALAPGARSPAFELRADARRRGILAYRSQSGLVRSGIDVSEGGGADIR